MTENSIEFQVQTDRILEILSKQIYDSPYAMVRENVQNAYDAILIRAKTENRELSEFHIEIQLSGDTIKISDDGIGMSEAVLRENFWKAGSSGKNNNDAKSAGVIGTFGIGAMANFGVCTSITVETRALDDNQGLRSFAEKAKLSIGKDCISLERIGTEIPVGTILTAKLESSATLNLAGLVSYLTPFIQFLPVKVSINGVESSRKTPRVILGLPNFNELGRKSVVAAGLCFELSVYSHGNEIAAEANAIFNGDQPIRGYICLKLQGGQIMGLRSGFGLAPLPVATTYQLGGYVDLPFLVPTAGREALNRETIAQAAAIFPSIEAAISEIISETSFADSLTAFQQHILNTNQIILAKKVKIQIQDGDEQIEMGLLREKYGELELQYYSGTDADTIKTFSSQERPLIRISQNHPRREIQSRFLSQILNISPIPDAATVLETIDPADLTSDEFSLTLAMARVLRFDYLLDDVDIVWARISHGVPMLAEMKGEKITLTLSRTWPALLAVLKVISSSYDLLDGFTKDLVRAHIYERISNFVPSSQRAGLDALQRTLERKRELYRLDVEDRGEIEPILADYIAGKIDIGQVLTAATNAVAASGQNQHVTAASVGAIENVLPDVVTNNTVQAEVQVISAPTPGSPIIRSNSEISQRILISDRELPQLNNHKVFLALSDRLFSRERDFFLYPHSTQVAWAGRRIVYLFSVANADFSLYYDIELRGNKTAGEAGGTALATTTIISSNRIFIPIPNILSDCFKVTESPIEFYVRFDILNHK